MSALNEVFAPEVIGAAQVSAAPGYVALSNRQVYTIYDESTPNEPAKYVFSAEPYQGDLRRYAVTGSQYNKDVDEYYNNIIAKYNYESNGKMNGLPTVKTTEYTTHVTFYRAEMLYARFAEALIGMAAIEGVKGADLLAMATLGEGLNENYVIKYNHVPADTTYVVDEEGNPVLNAEGSDSIVVTPATFDQVAFDFSDIVGESATLPNKGLHSRGSGFTAKNIYYAPTAENIASYFGKFTEGADSAAVLGSIERIDTIKYASGLLLDELALEFCFEGNRFGDLIRFAKFAQKCGAPDWQDILAKRVAGRAFNNAGNLHSADFEVDNGLYNMLKNEENWYLPLPESQE